MGDQFYNPDGPHKRVHVLQFKMTDDERRVLARVTHARQQSAAALIRALIAQAAEGIPPEAT